MNYDSSHLDLDFRGIMTLRLRVVNEVVTTVVVYGEDRRNVPLAHLNGGYHAN